jgi:hypothetical protein
MTTIRMSSEEMKAKYPITTQDINKIKELVKTETDLTDPDAPEITEEQIARATRKCRPLKEETKKSII